MGQALSVEALIVENLSAGYPKLPLAITDVSFSLRRGERAALIGPNGAGKSTLLKALVGLIPHHGGCISLHGHDCSTSHTLLGYVPQQESIDWNFPVTVQDVVMMGRTRKIGWLRWAGRKDRDIVAQALERVGMMAFRNRQIGQLSGGQKRRVFIARALAQETDVLLLDEPFNGVDVTAQEEIMETLNKLRDEDITVLLATHDLNLASSQFDKLLILNQRLIACGSPAEVFTPENLHEAYGGRMSVLRHRNHEDYILVVD
ncbi:MAG: metal ABC transporter ATP-binding protein [Phototrophicales bacterium]